VIDLRQAHWAWISHLSSTTSVLLPAAVFISMFFVQRMTRRAPWTRQQQKIMNIFMPIMMAYITPNCGWVGAVLSVGNDHLPRAADGTNRRVRKCAEGGQPGAQEE